MVDGLLSLRSFTLAMALALAPSALADDVSEQAKRLSELRTEVEQLAEELDLEREALRSELRSLELRHTELEARVRQEERRLEELERLSAAQREILGDQDAVGDILLPTLQRGLDGVEATIRAGLPYRLTDRLQAVDELRKTLEDGSLEPRRGAGRVWQLIEDELRLSRENITDRQVIALDGEDVLVQVARLGMVALYYKAEDGRTGMAVPEGATWTWRGVEGAEAEQLHELFDAMSKQVRVGWFELPMTLTTGDAP